MKTGWKVLLGVLSFEPIVFLAVFIFWLVPSFMGTASSGKGQSSFEQRFELLLPLAIASSILVLVLLVVYTVLLARRPDLQVVEKIGIPLGLIATNGIFLPLVWWLYIWRESNLSRASRIARVD